MLSLTKSETQKMASAQRRLREEKSMFPLPPAASSSGVSPKRQNRSKSMRQLLARRSVSPFRGKAANKQRHTKSEHAVVPTAGGRNGSSTGSSSDENGGAGGDSRPVVRRVSSLKGMPSVDSFDSDDDLLGGSTALFEIEGSATAVQVTPACRTTTMGRAVSACDTSEHHNISNAPQDKRTINSSLFDPIDEQQNGGAESEAVSPSLPEKSLTDAVASVLDEFREEHEGKDLTSELSKEEPTPEQKRSASEHYKTAMSHVGFHSYPHALEEANLGLQILEGTAPGSGPKMDLLQIRANSFSRLGKYRASLRDYRSLLRCALATNRPLADQANVLYACGSLARRLKRYPEALEYHEKELKVTSFMVNGKPHVAISRIYHELASICKDCTLDCSKALEYYERALAVEMALLEQFKKQGNKQPQVVEASRQIQKTKQFMGRCHFELGDMQKALQTTFN